MNLNGIPVIDTHAHPFPAETEVITADLLRDALSVSLRGTTSVLNESTMLSRVTVKELARFLGCEATFAEVIAARNAAASGNYPHYIARLFADGEIETLLVDHGFPAVPVLPFEPFAALLPRPPYQGYRIERFFPAGSFHGDAGAAPASPFDAMLDAFVARLDQAVAEEGCIFFKTVMAYRTGLAIRPVERAEAAEAWQHHRQYGDPFEKVIRDYLFIVTAHKAREYEIPLQVHTGHTSQTNVWPNVNPILLTPVLNSGVVDGTTIVLVHGGYPFCTEAGYLTSVYPDLYLDLSLMIPWASVGIASRMLQTLEAAPTAKLMYGSDGIRAPELHWIGAVIARRALGTVLDQLITGQFISSAEAEGIAQDISWRTAQRVYRLPIDMPRGSSAAVRSQEEIVAPNT
jgi:uncharacterized protein